MPACSAQPASPAPRSWVKHSPAGALPSWRRGLSVRALSHNAPRILAAHSGYMTHTGHSTPTGTGIHVTLHRAHTPHSTRDGRTDAHTDLAELGTEGGAFSGSELGEQRPCVLLTPLPAPKPHLSTDVEGKKPDSRVPDRLRHSGLGLDVFQVNRIDHDIIHNQTSKAQRTHLPNIHRESTINTTAPPCLPGLPVGGWASLAVG